MILLFFGHNDQKKNSFKIFFEIFSSPRILFLFKNKLKLTHIREMVYRVHEGIPQCSGTDTSFDPLSTACNIKRIWFYKGLLYTRQSPGHFKWRPLKPYTRNICVPTNSGMSIKYAIISVSLHSASFGPF
jgi:hypothetical protein